MHLTPTIQRGLLIGGIAALAVAAGVGLTRKNDAPEPSGYTNAEPVAAPVASGERIPTVYAATPFGSSEPGSQASESLPVPVPYIAPPAPAGATITPVVASRAAVRRRARARRRRVVVVRRRPFSHSVAIVGGSAAGGAAIGALAGGGKGALAGGLVGGAGGLVYDRLTHKKRRVVTR